MSDKKVVKLTKPVMRGMLHGQIKRNLILTGITCFIAGCYMRFVFGDSRKAAYAEFYKTYDIEKEFNRMKNKGLFQSCGEEDEPDNDE